MSDVVTGAGQAPAEQPAAAPVEAQPAPQEASPVLSDLLAQHRAEKQARARASQEAEGLKAKLAEYEAREKERSGSKKDILADPTGYLRSLGLTDQELPLVGEAVMYERMPDRAPADLRVRMLEAKQERERRLREQEAAQQATEAEARAAQEEVQRYRQFVAMSVQAGGDFPTSAAWFADSQEEYVESLMHTARNIAHAAQERGEVADLSPAAVRRTLEEHLSGRVGRASGKAQAGAAVKQDGGAPLSAKKEPPRGVSAQEVSGKSTGARPRAESEAERTRRAIAALEAFDR